jgi:hypothetical protein
VAKRKKKAKKRRKIDWESHQPNFPTFSRESRLFPARASGYVAQNNYSYDGCSVRLEIMETLTPTECRRLAKWLLKAARTAAMTAGIRKRWMTNHKKRCKRDKAYERRMNSILD